MNTRLPPERESKIQRAIMVRLRHRFRVRLWRRNVGALTDSSGNHVRFAAPGQSDLWGIMPDARHVEIEVKRPGNRPTPKQLEWLKEMHRFGCVAIWTDSANDAERVMEAILAGGQIVWSDGDDYWIKMP